jgi:DNA primase
MERTKPPKSRKDVTALVHHLLDDWDLWDNGGGTWRSCCPIHKGDNKTAFFINQWGYWQCFKCKASGSIIDLVVRLSGLPFVKAKELVSDLPEKRVDEIPLLPAWNERPKGNALDYEVLDESILGAFRRFCPSYLVGRGFTPKVLRDHEIGYDKHQALIVLPTRDVEGRLVGLTYRLDFDMPGRAKYWHDRWDKTKHLYGFHLIANKEVKNLFLVEGQLDRVRYHQLGIPAAAIMGSQISEQQVSLLVRHARCERIVLSFDNDEAGEQAKDHAMRLLSRTRFGRRLFIAKYPTKDPGELRSISGISMTPWASSLLSMR